RLEQVHMERAASATLWLVQMDNCSRYGSVLINADGAVQAFHEKAQENRAGLINAGTYLLERKLVETIPKNRAVSLETEFFPQLIGQGLYAVIGEGPFIDIGIAEELAVADEIFPMEFLT
ncbi:MAG: sugar phosphate nucleotidyltransferase, partial [Anaerolineales bacterium]